MAGYVIYSLDGRVFDQLTTAPTETQTLTLADVLLEACGDAIGKLKKKEQARWPRDRKAMAAAVGKRLASPDWYSDLSLAEAEIWNEVPFSLRSEAGESIGIGFKTYDYESIYWDCAEIAAGEGATMLAEPVFGMSGFRYFGKPASDGPPILYYSIFPNDRTQELLRQLEAVARCFEELEEGEGSPREQFFQGLLPPVKDAAENGRALFVQLDT